MTTSDPAPQHVCRSFGGRLVLMVEVPTSHARPDAVHRLVEREDFIGGWYGADRYMSMQTEHGSGRIDSLVYAPCARLTSDAIDAAIGVGIDAGHADVESLGVTTSEDPIRRALREAGYLREHHRFRDPELDRFAHLARRHGLEMAWSGSATMPYTLSQILTKAISLSADVFRALYYNNSVTPVNTATTALTSEVNGTGSAFQTANEQTTSGNYTQGTGMAVNTPAVTQNYNAQGANTVSFTAASITSATSFTSLAAGLYGMVVADTTVPGTGVSYIVSYNYFGGQQLVTAGTFAVTINANGIATYTC